MTRGDIGPRSSGVTRSVAAVVVGAAAWLAGGCASRAPFRLEVVTREVVMEPGGTSRVAALLTNPGKSAVRFTEDAKLRYLLSCRRPIDAPDGGGLIVGSALEGGVWGGITDLEPDPDDPLFCRSHPPRTVEVPPGGARHLDTLVEAPSSCVEGEVQLEVLFGAPDYHRPCPGIWYGETRPVKRPARLRRAASGEAIVPTGSPAALECALEAGGGASVRLRLRNPTPSAWRARVVPSLQLVPVADPDTRYWAPVSQGGEALVIAAGAEWSRAVALADLPWQKDYDTRPESALADLPRGSYTASLWLEVVGGKSWELRCSTATVELDAP